MASIESPQIALQIATRIRPRAEWFWGMLALLTDDLPALQAATVTSDQVIATGELPFTGVMLTGYIGLVQSLLSAATDDVRAAYQSAIVRPLDVILSGFPTAGPASGDPVVDLFSQRIQPRAIALRKLNYWFGNDEVAVTPNVTALVADDSDTIAEHREVSDLTVGAIKAILAFQANCASPAVNTADVSYLVESACGGPLEL